MFEDFATSQSQQQTQKRLRRSFALAIVVYGSAGAALVSASNTARKLIKEELTQVQFAQPEVKPEPKPEPPPPPVEAPKPKSARAGVSQRKALKPPDEMPTAKPTESEGPLVEPTESGSQDGVLGVAGGTGKDSVNAQPAPPPPPPKLIPAKEAPGNKQPPYPKRAQRDEIEGEVLVAFDVLEDGRVVNPKIVKGPAEFHEAVLQIALTWRYQPAMLGGKPVKSRSSKLVVFRLED
jgi:protein TonB